MDAGVALVRAVGVVTGAAPGSKDLRIGVVSEAVVWFPCFVRGSAAVCPVRGLAEVPPPRIISGDGKSDVGRSGIRSGEGEGEGFAIGSGICPAFVDADSGVGDETGSEWAVCARRAFLDSGRDGAGRWLGEGDGLARGEPVAAGLAEFPSGPLVGEGEAKGKSTSTASLESGERE